ncbi:septation protein SepH [Specibacter sp. RAF43]|uniref:septation protein SepH n=1 Tax=Specibacter sp. RAF43 TaxID=3233057 RepID=UPI003F9AC27A
MADLRLVGVHDDGKHLLLSGADGETYLLPIDEALRMATTRAPRRAPQAGTGSTRMSPREIQTQIRGGATASDVAEHSGLSLEQVRRYEGPVLAEREHVSRQARNMEVSVALPGHDGHRSAFGDNPASLEEMVTHRLAAFGIDPRTLVWDAWRVHDGSWTVTADFELGTDAAASRIGEPAPARWTFHPGRKSLHNANRWAQQLSELEPLDGPVPERRLSAVADRPFDFESENAKAGAPESPESPEPGDDYPGGGLLEMLRSRRGQRLGLDEDGDDDLAAMLGTHVPAAHPRHGGDEPGDGHGETDGPAGQADPDEDLLEPAGEELFEVPPGGDQPDAAPHGRTRLRAIPFLSLAPSLHTHDDAPAVGVGEVSTATREITVSGAPTLRRTAAMRGVETVEDAPHTPPAAPGDAPQPAALEDGPTDSEVAARLERKAAAKPKRSSVPSWDEIVFGTKGD